LPWSPRGDQIVAQGSSGLSVLAASSGERQLLQKEEGNFPEWSPDGKSVLFLQARDEMPRVWQIPASGGQIEQLTKGAAGIARWSLDGKQIYFVGLQAQANNIWQLSLSNRDERPITDLAGKRGQLGVPGLATDGQYIYFTWQDPLGDIWVADIGR